MRILALSYVFPNPNDPAWGIFILNRLKAVNKFCDVRVVSPVPWFPFADALGIRNYNIKLQPVQEVQGLSVYRPKFFVIPRYFKWLDPVSYFIFASRGICKFCGDGSIDIVDVHWLYPDILTGYFFAKTKGAKLIATVRGKEALWVGEHSLRSKITYYFLRKCDRVIALSSELGEIVKRLGVSESKIRVIPNGVDKNRFKYMNSWKCRSKLGLLADRKIILSVGSLIFGKGFHNVIEALPELSKKYNVEYYIVGDTGPAGDFRREILERITVKNLSNVHLVGAKKNEELVYWYNAADVFCLPSYSEGSPNVLLEALSCGTPVVASSVGGIPEIIGSEECGFLCCPGDYVDLVEKLDKALGNTWNRKRISEHFRIRDWSKCAAEIIEVYKEVLDS